MTTRDAPQWGVMFNDHSVVHRWNGRTQRQRAEEELLRLRREYAGDNITLAFRASPDEKWERVMTERENIVVLTKAQLLARRAELLQMLRSAPHLSDVLDELEEVLFLLGDDDVPAEIGRMFFDAEAQRLLGMSGQEFLRRWDNGEYRDGEEDEAVVALSMLIPFGRPDVEESK